MDDLICCSLRQSEILKVKLEWKLERAIAAVYTKHRYKILFQGSFFRVFRVCYLRLYFFVLFFLSSKITFSRRIVP
jgi:hypothetical protein